jgi:FkbM family methyltransferase
LASGDLVVDAGGYRGEWCDQILCRYGCRAAVLEPVPAYADALRSRYKGNSRVEVFQAALGAEAGRLPIAVAGEGSSLFRVSSTGEHVEVEILDAVAFLHRWPNEEIGCLKLNVEGAEYDILDRLLTVGVMARVRALLVQFHQVAGDSVERRASIQAALSRTHRCGFDYPFVWEYWARA